MQLTSQKFHLSSQIRFLWQLQIMNLVVLNTNLERNKLKYKSCIVELYVSYVRLDPVHCGWLFDCWNLIGFSILDQHMRWSINLHHGPIKNLLNSQLTLGSCCIYIFTKGNQPAPFRTSNLIISSTSCSNYMFLRI